MTTISFTALRNAFDFVSSGSPYEQIAYICLESGAIYWVSDSIKLDEEVPDDYNTVDSFFRKRGAYRRFKELLQAQALSEKWLRFEAEACEQALVDWCQEQYIKLIDAPLT